MLKISAIAVRALLIISAAVVLGLSVTLAKHQAYGSVPSITSFSAFVGAFGLIVAAIGLLSLWTDKIPNVVVLGADALSSLLFIAAGIALTVALKGVSSCTSDDTADYSERFHNKILNGGCYKDDDDRTFCSVGDFDAGEDLTPGRCKRARAGNVFQYIGFLCTGIALIITYLVRRRGGSSAAYV